MDYIPFLWDVFSRKNVGYLIVFTSGTMKLLLFILLTLAGIPALFAQEKTLLISNGGGIAGTSTVYKIDRDGTVEKGKGTVEVTYDERATIKKCTARKYFRRADALIRAYPEFNHPGNLYSSIAVMDPGHETKIVWGSAEHPVPDDVKKLFQKINDKLKHLTFTSEPRK